MLISHGNAIVWTTDSGKLKLLECFAGYIFAVYELVIYKIAVVFEFFYAGETVVTNLFFLVV